MATHTDPSKAPDTKPGAKPVAKDELQKLPLAEVEKRLSSSPDGLSEVEAKKRLTQYGPTRSRKRRQTRCSSSSATSGGRFPG
jgi:H+-transporting ATPase